ncbi:hypothetical protein ACFPIJ_42555 [Dactylosporangium cerinum]|uniref:Uncharacterized protein n=1 Tax=Dactylosporangium cerinum TaxID=1434730 RepID=A0ABV9WAH9_9ACTN
MVAGAPAVDGLLQVTVIVASPVAAPVTVPGGAGGWIAVAETAGSDAAPSAALRTDATVK